MIHDIKIGQWGRISWGASTYHFLVLFLFTQLNILNK